MQHSERTEQAWWLILLNLGNDVQSCFTEGAQFRRDLLIQSYRFIMAL